jgi:adenylyltransferase/sulfurtransferase
MHNAVISLGETSMTENEVKDLSEAELEFYSRQIVLSEVGLTGQIRLKNAKVCIVGLGGLGSPAALQLAAMGVGHLRLIDYDIVEISNLQRQILYSVDFLGYPKVEAAAERLRELNPNIVMEPLPLVLNADNAEAIIEGMDVVVDGLDRMAPRYALNRACQKLRVPYVFGAAIMTYGSVSTIIPSRTPCLECFQGNLDDDMLPKCAVVGVHPSVLGIVASVEVSEATRIILGQEPRLANKIFYCDVGNLEFETTEVSKVENCSVCGTKPSGPPMRLKQELVTEICGRERKRVFVITPRIDLKLDMDMLTVLIEKLGFNTQAKGSLGLTFDSGSDGEKASILRSGIMIVKGLRNKEDVRDLYDKIIVDGLRIPHSTIEGEKDIP